VIIFLLFSSDLYISMPRKELIGELRNLYINKSEKQHPISIVFFILNECFSLCFFFSVTDSQCFVKTTDGDCCIFPFEYRGKEYKNCAATEADNPDGLYWCATKSEFDRSVNGSGWGYCAGL